MVGARSCLIPQRRSPVPVGHQQAAVLQPQQERRQSPGPDARGRGPRPAAVGRLGLQRLAVVALFSLRMWQTILPSAASTACSSWYSACESPSRAGISDNHRQVCPSSDNSPRRPALPAARGPSRRRGAARRRVGSARAGCSRGRRPPAPGDAVVGRADHPDAELGLMTLGDRAGLSAARQRASRSGPSRRPSPPGQDRLVGQRGERRDEEVPPAVSVRPASRTSIGPSRSTRG